MLPWGTPQYVDYRVFAVNSDGTGLKQLTNGTNGMNPSISGDGSKIALVAYSNDNHELFVGNSDGTGLTQLFSNPWSIFGSSISDDGSKIAFSVLYTGIFVSVGLHMDENVPVTVDDYAGQWHTADFSINLTATDELSGVAQTYYKVNDGSKKTVATDRQPVIATEGANNTLEYWSVDIAGNEENHKILTAIKLDKTAPIGSITINNNDTSTSSTSVTLTLSTNDTSGVAQMRFRNNETQWKPGEEYSTSTAWALTAGDGTKTVYVQFKDNAGFVSDVYLDTITLDTFNEVAIAIETLLAGIAGVAVAAALLLYFKKRKH